MSLSDDFIELGVDLIQEFGSTLTITRTSGGSFVAETGEVAGNTTTIYSVRCVVQDAIGKLFSDMYKPTITVIQDAIDVYMPVAGSYTPIVGDFIGFGGYQYKILEIKNFHAQNIDVAYKVRAMK